MRVAVWLSSFQHLNLLIEYIPTGVPVCPRFIKNDRDLLRHFENGIAFTMPIALVETPIKSELLQYIVGKEDLRAAAMGCIQ